MQTLKTVVVIGAGIAGISSALWLQRSGLEVTVVDREGVAAGASYGNAGVIETSGVIPVTTPGILWSAPKLLFDRNEPLFLKWSYLPRLLPFLVRYLSHANERDMKRIGSAIAEMIHDGYEQHLALARGTPAEKYLKPTDYLYLYDTPEHFEAEASHWKLRGDLGLPYEVMTNDELETERPGLSGKFGLGIRGTHHGQITDPGEYTKALATAFEEGGGKIVLASVDGFVRNGHQIAGVKTGAGEILADAFVLAAGAWSNRLLADLDLHVPMESERGYHVEFVNPNIELKSNWMLRQRKFAMNSMEGRLRCGGIVEFGGLDAPPGREPFELLKRNALQVLPELEYDEIREWMGHRPSTSDSLPLVGNFAAVTNLWACFGHQHLGLTAGPKTGRWLAQMVTGETPNTDITPYSPNRF